MGCVSVDNDDDWEKIKGFINSTGTETDKVKSKSIKELIFENLGMSVGMEDAIKYGTMEVKYEITDNTNE